MAVLNFDVLIVPVVAYVYVITGAFLISLPRPLSPLRPLPSQTLLIAVNNLPFATLVAFFGM